MDYTNALRTVSDYTGWNAEDMVMVAEYSNGYAFMDREGREWTATQRYGEFEIRECVI